MPPERTSFFDDDSMVRRVHREQVMGFAGPRALLLMAAHPVAFEGFFLSTGSLGDPYARLRRTGDVLDAVAWGPAASAERLTARVRAMHARVTGTLTEAAGRFGAGTPYRADDPALLLWILACLVDSSVLVYDQYVASMDAEDRERYWQDYKVIGRLFGLTDADLPATWGDFRDYVDGVVASGDLHVTPRARELGIEIVMHPPVPAHLRPLVELANFVTVGLLPPAVRRQYGFSWDPARALARRSGAEYLKRVVVPLLPQGVRYVPSARRADAA